MTERESKLFERLKQDGWFDSCPEPAAIVLYDLSENEYKPEESKRGKKAPMSFAGSETGLRLCRGSVLFYPDRAVVWEEKKRIGEIDFESDTVLKAYIYDGCVVIGADNKIICVSRMNQKTQYYAVIKRLQAIREGKEPSHVFEDKGAVCVKCGRPLNNVSGDVCISCRSKKRYIKQLWSVAKESRVFLFLSVVLFFVVSAVNLAAPMLNRKLVDEFIEPKYRYWQGFMLVVLAIFAVNLFSRLFSILRSRALIRASNGVIVKLRETVFEKVQKMSVSNVSKRTAGNLMQRITQDTQVIQNFITNDFPSLIEQVLVFIGVASILIWYDWRLAIMIMLPMPVVIMVHRIFWSRMRLMYDLQWNKGSDVRTFLHDIFSGIRVVKAFGTEKRENEKFDNCAKEECQSAIKNERFHAIFSPLITFFIGVGEISLLYYVGYNKLYGDMSLGDIAMFTSYVSLIYGPLQWFGRLARQLTRMLNSTAKIFEILDEKIDVDDIEKPVEKQIDGYIEIQNVSFDYDERNEVLKNINLKVKPGEMIGIVGKSGVGKSTLINLVMRMYDVDEGKILIDGEDIRNYSQESLRSQIGAVLQETFLFSGTLYDNIAYAKPNATREEVIYAAKLAGAHNFIAKLPDAYNTKVGERGYTLSGGERQRVTIARALLHNPKILILDEATSSLDTETEKQIQDALSLLTQNRTTLAIAHRLSTLRNATRLIVLSEGTIAEEGTHEELMSKKGMYYDLVMAQRQMSTIKKAE